MQGFLGNSECSLHHLKELGVILKSSKNKRLITQIRKQTLHRHKDVLTAKVFGGVYVPPHFIVIMEHIKGLDFIEFLEQAKIKNIQLVLKKIINLIHFYLMLSQEKLVHHEVFIKKYQEVWLRCNAYERHEIEKWEESFIPNHPIKCYCGPCHGDLTFCNIIIGKDLQKVFAIDFLNPFLSSPLQDIVKLRQDSKHGWLVHKYNRKPNPNIQEKLAWIDKEINFEFKNIKHYRLFQFMNLIRIIPYSKNETRKFILNELERI